MRSMTVRNRKQIKYVDKPPKRAFGYVKFYSDDEGTLLIAPQCLIQINKVDLRKIISWCQRRLAELEK